jgi:hypothetical protein
MIFEDSAQQPVDPEAYLPPRSTLRPHHVVVRADRHIQTVWTASKPYVPLGSLWEYTAKSLPSKAKKRVNHASQPGW